jgi:hypothetical protein
MKGPIVSESRVVQFFLTPGNTPSLGIFEVSSDATESLKCSCPGFSGRKSCKHTRFVQARIDGNNGVYPMEISTRATQADADKARESNESFREFVLKYGKIEVC